MTRRRIDAAKRKKTPILAWHQRKTLEVARKHFLLPMSSGGESHDGEWMVVGEQEIGRDSVVC